MGFFGIFGSKNNAPAQKKKQLPWNELNNIGQLEEIETGSLSVPVAIFKHSTRCGISRMVLRNFEHAFGTDTSKMKLYFLDVLAHRNISDQLAHKFKVVHQSPQLIVIKNGVAVWHASHNGIDAGAVHSLVC
ncbi:MAG: bacillithiol system redox-active protein YtxJ [Marinirhabdus sp.]